MSRPWQVIRRELRLGAAGDLDDAPPLGRALLLLPIALAAPLGLGAWAGDLWVAMPLAYLVVLPAALLLAPVPGRRLRPRLPALVAGLVGAIVLYGLGALTLVVLAAIAPALADQLASLQAAAFAGPAERLGGWAWPILAFVVVGEELVWRGAVLLPLAARLGPWPALAAAAALYTLAHASAGPPLLAIAAAGAGIFWGWLRLRSASLAATILCHLLWDLLVIALAPYGALL